MTIKNRLSISNLLMIIIPSLLALIIGFFGITALWMPLVQQNNIGVRDLEDFEKASTFMVQQIEAKLVETGEMDDRPKISEVAIYLRDLTGYTVQIETETGRSWTWGDEPNSYMPALRAAADQLDETGIISTGANAVTTKKVQTNDGVYRIYIYGSQLKTRSWPGKSPAQIVAGMILLSLIVAAFFANRFLTRFVFRHIKEAIEELSKGVRQIRDGNLAIKIQYKTDDEFRPICEDFNDMARRLRESVALIERQEKNRKELLAGMSHDLRSPLTSIKAYTEGLIDGVAKTPEAKLRYLEMIRTKVSDIERMIANLFMFSKMEMDDYPYYPESLDLAKELLSFLEQDGEEYKAKGLVINSDNVHSCGKIFADPMQLRRIISNILENSLKYKEGDVGDLCLSCKNYAGKLQIILKDDGPGVPIDALPRLFDVFYRHDPSRSNPNEGSGLGLAIVQKAVRQMGGSIWAENAVPHGLQITIELPEYQTEVRGPLHEKDFDY